MVEPIEQPALSRSERKERTRRALLDGTLDLLADRGFSGLSLREVARGAGIVPTAFYRHFSSLDDLGAALAEDAMRMLRGILRRARRAGGPGSPGDSGIGVTIGGAVHALDEATAEHPRQFLFLLRERHGGTEEIRRTIDAEMRLLIGELAIDLARVPQLAQWEAGELESAAGLLVAAALDSVPPLIGIPGPARIHRADALNDLTRRLRLITLGMSAWQPER